MSYPDVPIDPNANIIDQLACWMGDAQLALILAIGVGNLAYTYKKAGGLWTAVSIGILGLEGYMLYYKYVKKGCKPAQ